MVLCGVKAYKWTRWLGKGRWRERWVSYNPWLRVLSYGTNVKAKGKRIVVQSVFVDGEKVVVSGVDGKQVLLKPKQGGELVEALMWKG